MSNATLKIAQRRPDLGEINSPFAITEAARQLFTKHGFTHELQSFYLSEGQFMTTARMEMEISKRFRDRFMSTICMEQGFSDMECVVLAARIAEEAKAMNTLQMDSDKPGETRLGK